MMKRSIAYWAATALVGATTLAAAFSYLTAAPEAVENFRHVGYPQQLRVLLGIGKLAGAIVLLLPRLPALKEWAYAGFTFMWIAAVVAHYLAADGKAFLPVVLLGLLAVSYVTRSVSRGGSTKAVPAVGPHPEGLVRRLVVVVLLALSASSLACHQDVPTAQAPGVPAPRAVRYGANPEAGGTFTHDGVTLYYEVYGAGDPLLIVHFNGGSIADMGAQIDHFRKGYKVIAMDSRDHGKSGDSLDKLTYEKMTDDLAALLDHLNTGPVDVLGWSDGGIEALLLGIRHPAKVKKIVAMAANLNPSDKALRPDVLHLIRQSMEVVPRGRRELKSTGLMLEEPNIEAKALEAITAPTLILASDHDTIVDHHTVEIYQHIPNGQLAIFPNATHMIPFDDPVTFNGTVERFLRTPFVKRDRIGDAFESLEKLRSLAAAG